MASRSRSRCGGRSERNQDPSTSTFDSSVNEGIGNSRIHNRKRRKPISASHRQRSASSNSTDSEGGRKSRNLRGSTSSSVCKTEASNNLILPAGSKKRWSTKRARGRKRIKAVDQKHSTAFSSSVDSEQDQRVATESSEVEHDSSCSKPVLTTSGSEADSGSSSSPNSESAFALGKRYNLRVKTRKLELATSPTRSKKRSVSDTHSHSPKDKQVVSNLCSTSTIATASCSKQSHSRASPSNRTGDWISSSNLTSTSKQSASASLRSHPTAETGACASVHSPSSSSSARRAGAAYHHSTAPNSSLSAATSSNQPAGAAGPGSSRFATFLPRRSAKYSAGHETAPGRMNQQSGLSGSRNGTANANSASASDGVGTSAASTSASASVAANATITVATSASGGLPSGLIAATSSSAATSNVAGGNALSATLLSSLPTALLGEQQGELTRLYELLEQRGLPQPLRDALGPRVSQILQRTIASSSGKTSSYLAALQSNDESQQLSALIELNQYLLMGNEETLAGFPIRQFVPVLVRLIRAENGVNLELCMSACRSLCYLMDTLPRSSALLVDAIPALLGKLQVIEYMDVTEQALKALEMLSKRNGRQIRQAGGIKACLEYIDFLSIDSQRSALNVTANCCQHMLPDEFDLIRPSLSVLVQRLATQDRRSVEHVCACFARLVDSYREQPAILAELAASDLMKNVQELLVVSPPLISAPIFVTLLRMLVIMCTACTQVPAVLLQRKFGETLCYLLVGTSAPADAIRSFEFVTRSPQELYELLSLIAEMLPKLPTDGLFAVDALLNECHASLHRSTGGREGSCAFTWQWRNDDGRWESYSDDDSRLLEQAYLDGEDEVLLRIGGRAYLVQFHAMQQRNEHTHATRSVQRRMNTAAVAMASAAAIASRDTHKPVESAEELSKKTDMANALIRTLFPILLHVYTSCSGVAVRNICVQAQLRMLYYADDAILEETLRNQPVAAHIAAMLSANGADLRALVAGLQIADTLMRKLPHVFAADFRRHGVVHQIERLARKWQKLAVAHNAAQLQASAAGCSKSGSQSPAPTETLSEFSSQPATSTGQLSIESSAAPHYGNPPNGPHTSDATLFSLASLSKNSRNERVSTSGVATRSRTSHTSSFSDAPTPAGEISGGRQRRVVSSAYMPYRTPGNSSRASMVRSGDFGDTGGEEAPRAQAQTQPQPQTARASSNVARFATHALSSLINVTRSGTAQHHGLSVTPTGSSTSAPPTAAVSTSAGVFSSFSRLRSATSRNAASSASLGAATATPNATSSAASTSGTGKLTDSASKRVDEKKTKQESGRTKLKVWIRDRAQRFLEEHAEELQQSGAIADSLIELGRLLNELFNSRGGDAERAAMHELAALVVEADMSAFELEHENFAKRLLAFLVGDRDGNEAHGRQAASSRAANASQHSDARPHRVERLRNALVAFRRPLSDGRPSLSVLLAKLIEIVQYREQFPVRLNETGSSGSAASGGFSTYTDGGMSSDSLNPFGARQLRLQLVRHPSCPSSSVAQLRQGTVRVDPLAPVATVERFLLARNLVIERDPGASRSKDRDRGAPKAPWFSTQRTFSDSGASISKSSSSKRDAKPVADKKESRKQRSSGQRDAGINSRSSTAAGRRIAEKGGKKEERGRDEGVPMDTSTRHGASANASETTEQRDEVDEDTAFAGDDHRTEDEAEEGATMMDWFAEGEDDDTGGGELITDDDDDFSDEYDDSAAYFLDSGARAGSRRIELLISDRLLPSHVSVLEAVTHYANDRRADASTRRTRQLSGATNTSTTDDTDTDSENPYSVASDVWTRTHTIYYRPVSAHKDGSSASKQAGKKEKEKDKFFTAAASSSNSGSVPTSSNADATSQLSGSMSITPSGSAYRSSKQQKGSTREAASKQSGRKLFSLFDSTASKSPSGAQSLQAAAAPVGTTLAEPLGGGKSPLLSLCDSAAWSLSLPSSSDVHVDPSVYALALLRILHAVQRYWYTLFSGPDSVKFEDDPAVSPTLPFISTGRALPLLSAAEFFSTKLIAKVNRQLQEPVLILTSTLPRWIPDLASACPFLFPFETRAVLFFIETFDRERALLRLTDSINVLLTSAASASSMSLGSRMTNGDPNAGSTQAAGTAASLDSVRASGGMARPTSNNANGSNGTNSSAATRLEKRRKVVKRDDLFKQAEKILNEVGGSGALLEIQYENESGTGLGPTLEFYALVSREFQKAGLDMWRNTHARTALRKPISSDDVTTEKDADEQLVFAPHGHYPAPISSTCKQAVVNKLKQRFRFLGRFMARALMDSRVLDLSLNVCMFKWLLGEQDTLCAEDVQHVDADLYRQFSRLQRALMRRGVDGQVLIDGATVDELCLDFTLPGYPHIELIKGGRMQPVTADNLGQYLHTVVQYTLVDGVRRQMESFVEGFSSVVQTRNMRFFFAEELDALFCGARTEPWDFRTLTETCRADHGYTMDSRAIKWLFEIMCSFNGEEQRAFLQFVTGSPRLPIGGFRALNPPLTIVRRTIEPNETASASGGASAAAAGGALASAPTDLQLPSVMTCVNYLKLPDYSSQEIMRLKLKQAIYEGKNYFLLS